MNKNTLTKRYLTVGRKRIMGSHKAPHSLFEGTTLKPAEDPNKGLISAHTGNPLYINMARELYNQSLGRPTIYG
jgi:hypothetical protein